MRYVPRSGNGTSRMPSHALLRRIPNRNASLCSCILGKLTWGWLIDFSDPWCRVMLDKLDDSRQRRAEVLRELREGCLTDHNKQPHVVAHHSSEFIRLIASGQVRGEVLCGFDLVRLNEHVGRNAQSLVKSSYHLD